MFSIDDRCVLNGIFLVLRSGPPWRDPRDQTMERLVAGHAAAVQMIDISAVSRPETRSQLSGVLQARINPNLRERSTP